MPNPTPFQGNKYGGAVTVASTELPERNCTWAIVPSVSAAVAASAMLAGAVKLAPLGGELKDTVGAMFAEGTVYWRFTGPRVMLTPLM